MPLPPNSSLPGSKRMASSSTRTPATITSLFATPTTFSSNTGSKDREVPMVEGAESITPEQVKANVAKGKTYILVTLNMGPTPRTDEAVVSPVRMQHLQQQFYLAQQGKLVINGPLIE